MRPSAEAEKSQKRSVSAGTVPGIRAGKSQRVPWYPGVTAQGGLSRPGCLSPVADLSDRLLQSRASAGPAGSAAPPQPGEIVPR